MNINKVFIIIFAPFVWILSLIIPKRSNLWVFGSWFGEKYSDNTKYLFEEITDSDQIESIWIAKSKKVISEVRSNGRSAFHAHSLIGIWYQMRAGVFLLTTNSKDFYFATLTPRSKIIQLWHGTPIKKIGFDTLKGFSKLKGIIRKIVIDRYNYVASPSKDIDNYFQSAFGIKSNQILRTPHPRCDGLFISANRRAYIRSILGIENDDYFVMYLPTHRGEGKDPSSIKNLFNMFTIIHEDLKLSKIRFFLKPHFYESKNTKDLSSLEYLKIYRDEDFGIDLYELLGASDALVTDISSVCFDYAATNRPIYFFMPDEREYIQNDRDTYFSINDIAPVLYKDANSLLLRIKEEIYSDCSLNNTRIYMKIKPMDEMNRPISRFLLEKIKKMS